MNPTFHVKLESLLNSESMENGSNTPDFMLAKYLMRCLEAFDEAVKTRDDWYNKGEGIEENPRKGRDGEPNIKFHKKVINLPTYPEI